MLKDLVVGDVIDLFQGHVVPADCILFQGMNITVDETMYGEGKAQLKKPSMLKTAEADIEPDNHKENPDNALLTGSFVMSGCGKAVVCSVGRNTLLGRTNR